MGNIDFNRPVIDERITYMNGILNTKLYGVAAGIRSSIKRAKPVCKYILKNWDNAEIDGGLKKIVDDGEVKIFLYKLWCIAKSRYEQLVHQGAEDLKRFLLEDVEDKIPLKIIERYEEIKEKYPDAVVLFRDGREYYICGEDIERVKDVLKIGVTEEDGKRFIRFLYFSLDMYMPKIIRAGFRLVIDEGVRKPKPIPEVKKRREVEEQHSVGERHPRYPWRWTEYRPGLFSWRLDKKLMAKRKERKEKKRKEREIFGITVKEFLRKVARSGKKPLNSDSQKEIIKMMQKGYCLATYGGALFLEDGGEHRKLIKRDSLQALLRRYGIGDIPENWIKGGKE